MTESESSGYLLFVKSCVGWKGFLCVRSGSRAHPIIKEDE